MNNELHSLDNLDQNIVMLAIYEVYNLPQSTLMQVTKLTKDKIDEIKQSEQYKTQVVQIKSLNEYQLNMEELVADPEKMQILVTTERMKLYKDLQVLVQKSVDILNDDLYATKKHLVLQSIALLTKNIASILADISRTATELQALKSGNTVANIDTNKILDMIATQVGNTHEN